VVVVEKLFVVDGGAAAVKIYNSDSCEHIGSIELKEDADSSIYDPSTRYMYVVNDADMTYTFISVIDTTSDKKLADIKIDGDSVEAMAIEKSGPRMFANMESKNTVAVIDRKKRTVIATWPTGDVAKQLVAMAFDESDHRLFITSHNPAKLLVLDSDTGKVVTSLPCVAMNDDMAYDPRNKRIYVSGSEFIDVFQHKYPDHYEQTGHIQGSFRAKTAILVPELNRYYLAVPRHGGKPAEVRTTGRHDPCVGIRATPIAEAMVALVLMDHHLRQRAQNAEVPVPPSRIGGAVPTPPASAQ